MLEIDAKNICRTICCTSDFWNETFFRRFYQTKWGSISMPEKFIAGTKLINVLTKKREKNNWKKVTGRWHHLLTILARNANFCLFTICSQNMVLVKFSFRDPCSAHTFIQFLDKIYWITYVSMHSAKNTHKKILETVVLDVESIRFPGLLCNEQCI